MLLKFQAKAWLYSDNTSEFKCVFYDPETDFPISIFERLTNTPVISADLMVDVLRDWADHIEIKQRHSVTDTV